MNFSLMYLLAKTPASAATAGSGNLLARLFDENTLKRMGAPGVTCSCASAQQFSIMLCTGMSSMIEGSLPQLSSALLDTDTLSQRHIMHADQGPPKHHTMHEALQSRTPW